MFSANEMELDSRSVNSARMAPRSLFGGSVLASLRRLLRIDELLAARALAAVARGSTRAPSVLSALSTSASTLALLASALAVIVAVQVIASLLAGRTAAAPAARTASRATILLIAWRRTSTRLAETHTASFAPARSGDRDGLESLEALNDVEFHLVALMQDDRRNFAQRDNGG